MLASDEEERDVPQSVVRDDSALDKQTMYAMTVTGDRSPYLLTGESPRGYVYTVSTTIEYFLDRLGIPIGRCYRFDSQRKASRLAYEGINRTVLDGRNARIISFEDAQANGVRYNTDLAPLPFRRGALDVMVVRPSTMLDLILNQNPTLAVDVSENAEFSIGGRSRRSQHRSSRY